MLKVIQVYHMTLVWSQRLDSWGGLLMVLTQKHVTWLFSRIIIPAVSIPVFKCHLRNNICWIMLILVGYHTRTTSRTMACITWSCIINTFLLLLVNNDTLKCLIKTEQAVWTKHFIYYSNITKWFLIITYFYNHIYHNSLL